MEQFKFHIEPHVQQVMDNAIGAYQEALPYRYEDQAKYVEVLNSFYKDEAVRRCEFAVKVQKDTDLQKKVCGMMAHRENLVNTIVDWGWTYDPRLAPIGLPTTLPMVLWPQQIQFLEWLYSHYLSQTSMLAEKSRDAGATWLICQMYIQEWRWTEGFAGGFGSNKLDNVDKRDDPDCIFEKLRGILNNLPSWWFPKGWVNKKHNKLANLINPQTGSNIAGQGGREIGRGGRRSIYAVDEAASLEFPEDADKALSQVTTCQLDVSTPKGMNSFGRKRHSGDVDVFSFSWRDDPRKDELWYKHECKRLRREVVAQEIDCDYHASVEGIFIKPEWIRAAIDLKLNAKGPCTAGLDVAAGGKNESALAIRKGPMVRVKAWDIDNAVDLVHGCIDICNDSGVEVLHYDKPGVGYAVNSTINRTERKMGFLNYGYEPAGSPSDVFYEEYDAFAKDIFKNARAEAYYNVARRFEKTWEHTHGVRTYEDHELVSIENDTQLIAELSNPKKIPTETGKIRVESKEQMLKRGIESPDRADALVMAFLPKDGGYKHVVEGYNPIGVTHQNFDVEWGKGHISYCLHYGAICIKKDMSINGICAIWNEAKGHLFIYDEVVNTLPEPSKVVQQFVDKMKLTEYMLDKMIGNNDMITDSKRTVARSFDDEFYKKCGFKQTVKIREAKRYDPYGSMTILNEMVKHKLLTVHTDCREINRQLCSWRLEKGKINADGMKEGLLMIVSELVKNVPLKEIIRKKEYSTRSDGYKEPKYEVLTIEEG